MDGIQYLKPGTALRLVGDLAAAVEQNPRDGVWLLARCPRRDEDFVHAAGDRFSAAAESSVHGLMFVRDPESLDLLVYVHADDILDVAVGSVP